MSSREIENLQLRIKNLQEAENYRMSRYEKERSESAQNAVNCQELREKLRVAEKERDSLKDRMASLQSDIERSAQRETRLTESLSNLTGHSQTSASVLVPQQLLSKLKEMNEKLTDNVRENRQLSNTLHFLTDERHQLQKRVVELEQLGMDKDELEERANHLFGKYLRSESFRRSLVHQKRYLLVLLGSYEVNEARMLSLVNGAPAVRPKQRPSLKTVVLVVIAIERMKFILRRWHTGKRVGAKSIFNPTPPRRTLSASTINWARTDQPLSNKFYNAQSPPTRERTLGLRHSRSTTMTKENTQF